METQSILLDQLHDTLRSYRFTVGSEAELQEAIEKALIAAGITYEREMQLSARDRPDFMVGDIAIEVKVKGSWSEVSRQLLRYVAFDSVFGVLLVTTCSRHANVPNTLNDKPIRVMVLWPL